MPIEKKPVPGIIASVLLNHDRKTGFFTYKERIDASGRKYSATTEPAGEIVKKGYRRVWIQGERYGSSAFRFGA